MRMDKTGRKKCLQIPEKTCLPIIFVLLLAIGISAQDKEP